MEIHTNQQIRKSQLDKREYLSAKLSNDLLMIAVKDGEAEKSAVSMSVRVGSLFDPKEYNGLAHFLEHMLFLGTDKYPNSSEYRDYLTQNSGDCNAYTAEMETNYHFQVKHEALDGAIDRFAQFFICPQMTEDLASREMNAVNSEHSKNIENDAWRDNRLSKILSYSDSEFNMFSTGNLETLNKPEIRQTLLSFYQKYYSSNIMKLCIVTNSEPEQTINKYKELFEQIKNHKIDFPKLSKKPYDKNNLMKIVKVVPSKDNDRLTVMFNIDEPMDPHFKKGPSDYLSHLIGHEGQNSLYSLLEDEGYCYSLSAGGYDRMDLFHMFNIDITLTQKGYQQYQEVLEIVFKYIQMLKQKGIQQWVFDEKSKVNKIKFDFKNKEKPQQLATSISSALHRYSPEDVLCYNYDLCEYDPQLIEKVLNQMSIDNCLVVVHSKQLQNEVDQKEQYYGIEYKVEQIDQAVVQKMQDPQLQISKTSKKLDLPVKNTFIADSLALKDVVDDQIENSEHPIVLNSSELSTLHFRKDNEFKVPKSAIYVKLFTNDNNLGLDSKSQLFVGIWQKVVKKKMNETVYLAEMANIHGECSQAPNGISLVFSGLNDKLDRFAEQYLQEMLDIDIDQFDQEIMLNFEKIKKNYKNYIKNQSYQIGIHFLQNTLKQNDCQSFLDLQEEAEVFSISEFKEMYKKWLKTLRMEIYVCGNTVKEEALDIQQRMEKVIKQHKIQILSKELVREIRVTKLPHDKIHFHEYLHQDPNQQNSCLIKCYQQQKGVCLENNVLLSLLVQVLKSEAFEQLRTREQLGYVVFTYMDDVRGVRMLSVLVQSDVKSPHYLATRVQSFLLNYFKTVEDISLDMFETHKQSLIVSLSEKDYSIFEKSNREWNEICSQQFIYDRKQKQIQILKKTTKEQLIEFGKNVLFSGGRQLEMMVVSHKHKQENEELRKERIEKDGIVEIKEIKGFKRRMSTFPDYYSML